MGATGQMEISVGSQRLYGLHDRLYALLRKRIARVMVAGDVFWPDAEYYSSAEVIVEAQGHVFIHAEAEGWRLEAGGWRPPSGLRPPASGLRGRLFFEEKPVALPGK